MRIHAQESAAISDAVANARILDSQEVDLGPRSIIYNRLETPALKPEPKPDPAPLPQREISPTAEEIAAIRASEAKSDVSMSLSCTVYDRKLTEVYWHREDGEYVIWSGIDFNYLRGLFDFETEVTRYSVFLGIGKDSLSSPSQKRLSPVSFLTSNTSQYRIVGFPKTGIAPEVKTAMDDIHHYFDANRERLIREYEESEKARIAQEAWLKAHPPQQKDTTVNFFPIRSSANGESGGSR